jgi:thymidine phosphorylase
VSTLIDIATPRLAFSVAHRPDSSGDDGREAVEDRVRQMHVVDVIHMKRDGHPLSDEQIDWVLAAYTRGDVADEQMASLAMAILLNGMDAGETSRWTQAMIDSGEVLSFGDIGRPLVDKHSTGGVGDKITLPLAPLVAACGAAVPQLSGRGLGHTGGTLDKLESIPGWRASLSLAEIAAQLADVGAVVCATTPTLAPADRKLYALRDVTGTVESIPLIASSIMSKKIAEGTGGLVLDVKVGSGAFMKTPARARELAETMVRIGTAHGLATTALLTDMSVPLGRAVGNALEVAESVDVLRGAGPADVVALTVALAREMLALAKIDADPAEVLASGAAYAVWERMIAAQGGDPSAALPVATHVEQVLADASGVVAFDALAVGVAAWRLGAGRARKEDAVQAGAGVLLLVGPGEQVTAGQPLLELHTDTPDLVAGARAALASGVTVGDTAPVPRELVLDTVRSYGLVHD